MKSAVITGVGGYVPEKVLSNKDLEKMVETTDEWITSRTGIQERRIIHREDWGASDLAAQAVKQLLEKTDTDANDIDMIICATVTPDHVFPDTGNIIADKVGAKRAFGYDISAACSGFLYAYTTGCQFIRTGMYRKVIVVGVDVMSSIIDYTDRATCIIFGDGAGAVLLEPSDEDLGYQDAVLHGDGSGRHYLYMKSGGSMSPTSAETVANKEHYVTQDGKTVFKHAVKGMSDSIISIMDRNHLKKEDVDWVVPHQANIRIINSVAHMVDFPMEKVMLNIEKYGNTTAATLPLCLWDYEDRLKKGDKIIMTTFGGGFTWGAAYLKWAY